MVRWYEFALWVHVFAAIVWVGGALMIQLYAWRMLRTDDPFRLAAFAKDTEWIASRLFTPASIVLLAFGFVLVEEGNWG